MYIETRTRLTKFKGKSKFQNLDANGMFNPIVFIGTVGAGKSTQKEMLKRDLEKRKIRVKLSLLKRGHLLTYILEASLAFLFTSKRANEAPIRSLIEERPRLLKNLFVFWVSLDILSIYVKFFIDIYLPLKFGLTVIVEDYLPATLADYAYLSDKIGQDPKRLDFLFRMIQKLAALEGNTGAIFLDANNDSLRARWSIRKSFGEKMEYLEMQRNLVRIYLDSLIPGKTLFIDTTSKTI